MATSVSMILNGYTFDPVPLLNISAVINRTNDGNVLGKTYSATVNGLFVNENKGGNDLVTTLCQMKVLRSGICDCSGCGEFSLECGGTKIFDIEGIRVNSFQFNEGQNNWTQTVPYTINFEWNAVSDKLLTPGDCYTCLGDVSDSWSIEEMQDVRPNIIPSGVDCEISGLRRYQVNHDVSATAKDCCIDGVNMIGWETARDWVLPRLGFTLTNECSGVFEVVSFSGYTIYDHFRVKTLNKEGGIFGVNETFILSNDEGTDTESCIETFNVTCQTSNSSRFKNFSVDGEIRGLEKKDANFNITKTKFESASQCWAKVQQLIIPRINCICDINCPVNPVALSTSVLSNVTNGIISYNHSYNDRPLTLVSGAISEQISISDSIPSDVVGRISVLGRKAGPILFSCNSITEATRTASINVVLPQNVCPTGLTVCNRLGVASVDMFNQIQTPISEFFCCLESGLVASFNDVYKISDNQNFDPVGGTYSRDVTWLYQDCDTPTGTSFCALI